MSDSEGKGLTRREFLKLAAAGAAMPLLSSSTAWANPARSRIVTVLDPKCAGTAGAGDDQIDARAVQAMLDGGIRVLTGKRSMKEAWRAIIPERGKKVAVKVNLLNPTLFTHRKVVDAVTSSLINYAGVRPWDIFVFDRSLKENARCPGFEPDWAKKAARFVAVDQKDSPGWRKGVWINGKFSRVAGFIRGGGRFECAYIINVPVPNAHSSDGAVFSAALKNHYGCIEKPWEHHHARLPQSISELNAQDFIREKTRLIVGDAIFMRAEGPKNGGPTSSPKTLVLGRDPVAFDRVCLELINEERRKLNLAPLGDIYLRTAARAPFMLGENDLRQIAWVKLGSG